MPVAAPGPPHPRRQKVGEEFDSLLSAPPGRRFRGILRRRADLPRDSAGWPSSSLSNQVIGRRRGPRRARSRPTAPPRRQKLGEEFFPRGFYLSPRHNTGKRTQPTERILPPLSAPPDHPSPTSYSARRSFREILQRPTALPRDSAGPVHISPTFRGDRRSFRRTLLTRTSASPSNQNIGRRRTTLDAEARPVHHTPLAETRGRVLSAGFLPFPQTQHGETYTTHGKNSSPTFCAARRPFREILRPRSPSPTSCAARPPFPHFLQRPTVLPRHSAAPLTANGPATEHSVTGPFPVGADQIRRAPRRGAGAPSPAGASGRCTRWGSAPGSPGARARPPRTGQPARSW